MRPEVLLKPGQELKQVARLKFRQQFYHPSFPTALCRWSKWDGSPACSEVHGSASVLFHVSSLHILIFIFVIGRSLSVPGIHRIIIIKKKTRTEKSPNTVAVIVQFIPG